MATGTPWLGGRRLASRLGGSFVYKLNVDRLRTGARSELLAVVNDLARVENSTTLTAGERRMLQRARNLLEGFGGFAPSRSGRVAFAVCAGEDMGSSLSELFEGSMAKLRPPRDTQHQPAPELIALS